MATEAHGNTRKNKFNEVRSDKAVGAGAWMGNSLLCVFAVNYNIPGAHGAPYVRSLKYFRVLPWPLPVFFSSHFSLPNRFHNDKNAPFTFPPVNE
jgi:hypothetical protein